MMTPVPNCFNTVNTVFNFRGSIQANMMGPKTPKHLSVVFSKETSMNERVLIEPIALVTRMTKSIPILRGTL